MATEPNLLARVGMWQEAWSMHTTHYPFGTGVPPSYAFGMAIDSYWIYTLIQGTLLFTLAFLLLPATVFSAGYACSRLPQPNLQALGLTALAFTLSLAISSLFISAPLQPFLIIPFWSLAGLAFAGRNAGNSNAVSFSGHGVKTSI